MIGLVTACLAFWLEGSPAVLEASRITETVTRFVEQSTRGSGESTQVDFRRVPDTLAVSSASYQLRVEPVGSRALRGAASLMIDVVVDGKVERRVPVSLTVRTYGPVVLAARALDRHAVIGPGDVRTQQMETTKLTPGYCRDVQEILQHRTKRMFPEGGILYGEWCENLPLIRQGDVVTLIVRAGAVTLSTPAIAKQDGVRGGLIWVHREGSPQRMRSRVLDEKTVEAYSD